jgi:phage tail P2-like protein
MSKTLLPWSEAIEHKNFDISTRKNIKDTAYLLDVDPRTCDVMLLPYLAQVWQVPFWDANLSFEEKRELILNSQELHKHIGTKWAVEKALKIIDVEGEVVQWFEELDYPFEMQRIEPYGFRVIASIEALLLKESTIVLDELTQKRLVEFISKFKNERSHFELYLKANFQNEKSFISVADVTEMGVEYCKSRDLEVAIKDEVAMVHLINTQDIGIYKLEANTDKEVNNEMSIVTKIEMQEVICL